MTQKYYPPFEKTMDIYAEPGTVVTFRARGGWPHEKVQALTAGFELDDRYTVKLCEVGPSRTSVYFEEIGGGWNSCLFADLEPPKSIERDLDNLLQRAVAEGKVIEVRLESKPPLAMRNYEMAGFVRDAR